MSVHGLRIHIAGSAAADADRDLLGVAHSFVRALTRQLIDAGAGLVLGAGDEPLGDNGLPCTFDWTALEAVSEMPDPSPGWPESQRGRFRVAASQRGLEKIPDSRRDTWTECTNRSDFELETSPPGWQMGGVIRSLQVLRGDVLVVLGGGAGVEELAARYVDEGKKVIPLSCKLGAFTTGGSGGGSHLHQQALSDVDAFFALRDGVGSAAARLANLRLEAATNADAMVAALVSLLQDLRPPPAFYVRLLASDCESFGAVERFFRDVVDPVVAEKGFTRHEVGRDRPTAAFINNEIFEGIHRAGLVVVDLTDVRPNCTMELGYALARGRRVIVSARSGTSLPFDSDKLPTHFWDDAGTQEERISKYRHWFERNIDLPPMVK